MPAKAPGNGPVRNADSESARHAAFAFGQMEPWQAWTVSALALFVLIVLVGSYAL